MKGRIENKIKTEELINNRIQDMPSYIKKFYLSLNQKTHMTKLRYMDNVIRFLNDYTGDNINALLEKNLKKISVDDIEQYISKISFYNTNNEIKELSNATKACIYSSLNAFFTFLTERDIIKINPFTKGIDRPKKKENDVVFLTPDEVKQVEEYILSDKNNKYMYRDLLLFRIPVITGIRVTALSEINISDIDWENNLVNVIEKGNISRKIYFDSITRGYICKWIYNMKRMGVDEKNDVLFIGQGNNRITVRTIENKITKYCEKVIPNKHITPHKLRSTCGTNLYQSEKDIYLVSSVLGHKSTEPTKRYTKMFETDKINAVNKLANLYK